MLAHKLGKIFELFLALGLNDGEHTIQESFCLSWLLYHQYFGLPLGLASVASELCHLLTGTDDLAHDWAELLSVALAIGLEELETQLAALHLSVDIHGFSDDFGVRIAFFAFELVNDFLR